MWSSKQVGRSKQQASQIELGLAAAAHVHELQARVGVYFRAAKLSGSKLQVSHMEGCSAGTSYVCPHIAATSDRPAPTPNAARLLPTATGTPGCNRHSGGCNCAPFCNCHSLLQPALRAATAPPAATDAPGCNRHSELLLPLLAATDAHPSLLLQLALTSGATDTQPLPPPLAQVNQMSLQLQLALTSVLPWCRWPTTATLRISSGVASREARNSAE